MDLLLDENNRCGEHECGIIIKCFAVLGTYKIRPLSDTWLYNFSALSRAIAIYITNACERLCYAVPRRDHITSDLVKNQILSMRSSCCLKCACFLHSVLKNIWLFTFSVSIWRKHMLRNCVPARWESSPRVVINMPNVKY